MVILTDYLVKINWLFFKWTQKPIYYLHFNHLSFYSEDALYYSEFPVIIDFSFELSVGQCNDGDFIDCVKNIYFIIKFSVI